MNHIGNSHAAAQGAGPAVRENEIPAAIVALSNALAACSDAFDHLICRLQESVLSSVPPATSPQGVSGGTTPISGNGPRSVLGQTLHDLTNRSLSLLREIEGADHRLEL